MEEENFHKQRRNLILLSFTVIFFNLTGAEISNINLLGNEIYLPNNEILPAILFLVLLYFLIRYGQYVHGIKDKTIVSTLDDALERSVGMLAFRVLDKAKYRSIIDARENGTVSFRAQCALPLSGPKTGSFPLIVYDRKDRTNSHLFEAPVDVTKKMYIIGTIDSYIYLIFRTHLFTEFFFPVLLCFLCFLSFNSQLSNLLVSSLRYLTQII